MFGQNLAPLRWIQRMMQKRATLVVSNLLSTEKRLDVENDVTSKRRDVERRRLERRVSSFSGPKVVIVSFVLPRFVKKLAPGRWIEKFCSEEFREKPKMNAAA